MLIRVLGTQSGIDHSGELFRVLLELRCHTVYSVCDTADGPDGDPADSFPTKAGFPIVDIVLDVTFETSKETLKAARRAAKPRPRQNVAPPPALKPETRVGYRVQLSALKQNSKYFDNLLSDTRFAEARSIEQGFKELSLRNVKPSEADAGDLPVVRIHEDDEATRSAGHVSVFEDLLRILHREQSTSKAVIMHYLAVLAVLADRFDCRPGMTALPYPGQVKRSSGKRSSSAWLLDQPLKLHAATRELIMSGSRR
ncbi:hypothetical protein MYCTH_2130550 [Thermothelomyces thermophilus ATCC 42464]|uniref:Uncharacterized protein n=1 Tax=Thermothelomyces thermophilus (strain ATCC 42464 / BCRC 31852 / DSM 1799) TaxID=573729 RepID=G2QP68_THET4|nr:uncharacterized protein MYCTH_2130550 [Thermothelomyces thermophilus ATCC 42464]AEO61381.1 hypothetical protein MYCTH_2130550 [Thermothelomyces thermophilus ATCC 42464]